MPGMRWCRYSVSPIGTTLRPPDESQGITSDMVVPIAPNMGLTPDRQPIRPTPAFPFSNCYHWIFNDVTVRVRVYGDGVEHDGSIMLSPEEFLALKDTFTLDCERIERFFCEDSGAAQALTTEKVPPVDASPTCGDDARGTGTPALVATQDDGRAHVLLETYHRLVTERDLRRSVPGENDYKSEKTLCSSREDKSRSHEEHKQSSVTPETSRDSGIDLFGWDPDSNNARIPLVDAWFDIDKHLTEDCIPSPLELEKEFKEIES